MVSLIPVLERFDEAEIDEVCGVDLSLTRAPTMTSLEDAQALVDTLWDLAKVLLQKGTRTQDLSEQKESLKTLLSAEDEEQVNQGIQLMMAMDDPELWAEFAAGLSVEHNRLDIGGLIKGWVQPQHQLHVALLVGQHAGIFTKVPSIDVSAYVEGLRTLPFQGGLGQSVWPDLQDTPLTLMLRENTYPGDRSTDISAIGALTNLTSLSLVNWQALRSLQPLTRLTRLTRLELSRCTQVRNLTPLKALTNLTVLCHDGKAVRNLRPLEGLTKLTTLKLSGEASISNLRPLEGLTSLTSLTLSLGGKTRDLAPLKGLTSLTSLTLYGASAVRDLAPLEGLTSLTSLTLYNTRAKSLRPLHGLRDLVYLYLGQQSSVSTSEIHALQSALPSCRIS